MRGDLWNIIYNLTLGELQKMEFPYHWDSKLYQVKAYKVGKNIRIDIEEKQEPK